MSNFTRFSTPALQGPKDFQTLGLSNAALKVFQANWSQNLAGWTEMAAIGDPWSNDNDAPRDNYYNPLVSGMGDQGDAVVKWTPFPNRMIAFFTDPGVTNGGQLSQALTTDEIMELADTGKIEQGGTTFVLNDPQGAAVLLKIPADRCPQINWTGAYSDFSPAGPRGWQDEYCEWSILRNPQGKMTSIAFTCENPAYYLTLWRQDPQAVLGLYQTYIDPAVQIDDLYLRYAYDQPTGKKGDPVIDFTTGHPAYDPTNKWNRGPDRVTGQYGGAAHLSSPPNTLSAEIYLAGAATIQRSSSVSNNPQSLICCAKYGQNFRNSDPNIGFAANGAAAKSKLTLTDPVGLYLQQPQNLDAWQGPNGEKVGQYWKITRGTAGTGPSGSDQILHAVFELPASAGFTIEDCSIYGQSIDHAGVILNQMKVALSVTLNGESPDLTQLPCVTARKTGMQPWPVQFVPQTLFYGQSPSDLPALLVPGSSGCFVLVAQGADKATTPENARVQFSSPDVTATVTEFLKDASAVPGQTDGGGTQGFIMMVDVAAGATPGPVQLRVLNPDEAADPSDADHPWEQGLAIIPAS